MIGDSCVIGAMVDGSCSPWVMCSNSVVRGNQIRDSNKLFYRQQL